MQHLRVTAEKLEQIAKFVRDNARECLVVKEAATRDHIHCLFMPRKKVPQFRKDLKKTFPYLEGNKSYALENVKSHIGMEDYLCKGESLGKLPHILEKSPIWTEEKIEGHHKSYWERFIGEEQANIRAKQGSDSVVQGTARDCTVVKIRQPTFVEKIARKIVLQEGEEEVSGWRYGCEITRKKVARYVLNNLRDNGKAFDLVILKRLTLGVMHQILPEQSSSHLEDALVRFLDAER